MSLADLSAIELRDKLATGEVRAIELTEACLQRIEETDADIEAWAYLDPDHVRKQADLLDQSRKSGRPIGPLHGLPIAVKDIIDVEGMPTENGSPIFAGNYPRQDAGLIARLRQAGAILAGKAVTTELAVFHPGKTKNPLDKTRTPGGSSSGSAAAVAARQVPLGIGTQTNGSVIRPASFCGIVGYKPTYGMIPRTGVISQSPFLDTIGVFANSVEDAALFGEIAIFIDQGDPANLISATPRLTNAAASQPPLTPTLGLVKTARWNDADDATQKAFGELSEALGGNCDEVELPSVFDNVWDWHQDIQFADIAKNYGVHYQKSKNLLSDRLIEIIEIGQKVLATDYETAKDWREILNRGLDEVFERYDAILTPAAIGEAPVGTATGDPVFSTMWTLLGMPCISLPLFDGPNGMPIGVQLAGPRRDDARLIRTANWITKTILGNN